MLPGASAALSRQWKEVLLLIAAGILVPLGFVLYTQQVWEDYFITFRHSQNLCQGNGLVYNPGERVHGFTSPLGVLLPAAFYALGPRDSYLPALWLFRAVSIVAFVLAGFLVLRRLARPPALAVSAIAFVVLYVLDVKAVAFSVNGMETGFVLLFAGWCLYLWNANGPRVALARGCAWAGLMWTRPDGCVYIAAFAFAELAFTASGQRLRLLRSLVRSAAVAAAIYLPWFLFAWSYYGSPVPETIWAKAPIEAIPSFGMLLSTLYSQLPHRAACVFAPIYFPLFWPEPQWLYAFSYALGVFCLCYWLLPVEDRLGRTASLSFLLLCLYLSYMVKPFPWYLPPIGLCGLLTLACGIPTIAVALARRIEPRLAWGLAGLALCGVLLGEFGVFRMTVRQVQAQQALIETGQREQIGLWLRNQVQANDSVFLEPVGYIGYFSGARIRDWPGLVTPQIVKLRHEGFGYAGVIDRIQPQWLVLRPYEIEMIYAADPGFKEQYLPLKLFDVTDKLRALRQPSGPMPGENYLDYDATYLVFKRKASSAETPAPELQASAAECSEYLAQKILVRHVDSSAGASHD